MCILCEIGSRDPSFRAIDALSSAADAPFAAAAARPSLSTSEAAGRIAETAWSQPAAPITYAFRASSPDSAFQRLGPAQIQAAERALELWSDVANVRFQRVGGGITGEAAYRNDATLLFNGLSSSASYAYAYLPGDRAASSRAGDVFLNLSTAPLNDMSLGGYGFMTMIHEIGHAVGLSHPGDYDAGANRPITYGGDAEYAQDTRQYSVMSYFDASESGADHAGRYAVTPLLHDIAAIQLLYGANSGARGGDTVYGFHATADRASFHLTSGSQRAVFAIWDGGGADTLDLSGYGQTQRVDLAADSFSDVGGLARNVAIAVGVVVENAVGGSGADRIAGNSAANTLRGQDGGDVLLGLAGDDRLDGESGDDELDGGEGDDHLVGGSGDDVLRGGGGADTLIGAAGRDTFVFSGDGAFDTVLDFSTGDDRIRFEGFDASGSAQVFWFPGRRTLAFDPDGEGGRGRLDVGRLELQGSLGVANIVGPDRFVFIAEEAPEITTAQTTGGASERFGVERRGGDGNDTLIGGDGADRLFGQGGEDTLRGEAGDDEIHGEDGNDRLEGGEGEDRLGGGNGDDHVLGGRGRDRLSGGVGRDEMHGDDDDDELSGEDGDDRLGGGHGNDHLSGQGGDDEMFGGAGNDELHGEAGRDRLFGEDGNDRLHGGDSDDRLEGGEGEDELHGGSGQDRLEGGGGGDRLFGGDGDDAVEGGGGNDRLEGGEGADRLWGGRGDDGLNGGGGADVFVFTRDAQRDSVADFRGEDVIEFREGLFGDFAAVMARATQSGGDTLIEDSGTQFVLQNVQRSSLAADDFRFA